MGTQSAATATPLHLLRMTDGLIVHQSLCAAAKLGIADLLKDGARSTTDLAATLQINDDALYRTLRFELGHGEDENRPFPALLMSLGWVRIEAWNVSPAGNAAFSNCLFSPR